MKIKQLDIGDWFSIPPDDKIFIIGEDGFCYIINSTNPNIIGTCYMLDKECEVNFISSFCPNQMYINYYHPAYGPNEDLCSSHPDNNEKIICIYDSGNESYFLNLETAYLCILDTNPSHHFTGQTFIKDYLPIVYDISLESTDLKFIEAEEI